MPSTKRSSAASAAVNNKANSSSTSSRPTVPRNASPAPGEKSNNKVHKRSRSGCFTCRLRRKKCDEAHPACGACTNLSVRCEYKRPAWWGNSEERRIQKERIKNKIKQTKVFERHNAQNDSFRNRNPYIPSPTAGSPEYEFNPPMWAEPHDTFSSYIPGPGFGVGPYGPYAPQYEVDVTTERQTFINDVPMRLDSSTSTFSSFAPPPLSVPLPAYPGIECYGGVEYLPQASALQTVNPAAIGPSPDQVFQGEVQVQDQDEGEQILVQDYLLLDHFFSMVLPQLFPVLEAHREGYFTEIVTEALESSWPYYWPYWHCCLSAAAVHRKTTEEVNQKQIDNDIMYHRCQTITQLNKAFKNPTNLKGILDTALAQIFLNCSVGHCPEGTSNDKPLTPPDVPWVGHFEAAKDIVERFELPPKAFEFNMKLISWIDILGSTMLGHSPHFAGTYREKLRYGIPSGLQELMGCDDRIMYLISEIACLESGKHNGLIDDSMAREFVAKLGEQLDHTQPANLTLQDHSLSIGPIPPASLTNIITHIFRNAARIYLRSLEPGFDRNDPSIKPLVKAVENAFQCIPMGPAGFDRSLVWPLFMTGVFSTPGSSFRKTLKARAEALGYQAKLGSFGRMMKLLTELWGSGGHSVNTPETSEDDISSLTSPISKLEKPEFPTSAEITLGGREIKPRQVHWRDLMRQKGWHYLLI